MKTLVLAVFALFFALGANAQNKYIAKTGHVWFHSEAPLETIEAHNNQAASVIDIKAGTIAFEIIIKSFKFEKALMEEHFNENYMESGKFPKSVFTGKFVDFDVNNFSKDGSYKAKVEGDLTIHGVKKHIVSEGTVEVKKGVITAKSLFKVSPEEYGIQIPAMAKDKIAKTLDIHVDIKYDKKK